MHQISPRVSAPSMYPICDVYYSCAYTRTRLKYTPWKHNMYVCFPALRPRDRITRYRLHPVEPKGIFLSLLLPFSPLSLPPSLPSSSLRISPHFSMHRRASLTTATLINRSVAKSRRQANRGIRNSQSRGHL